MNTSILGDKIIVFWQVLAFGCILGSVFYLLPWFIGRLFRWRGVEPPSLGRVKMACVLTTTIGVFISPVVLMMLLLIVEMFVGTLLASDEWLILPVMLLVWIGSSVVTSIIVLRLFLSKSAEGRQSILLPAALGLAFCALGTHMCVMPSLGRMKILAKRCIDGSNLNGIGKGLVIYHDEYGAYPDDLRRLVDFGWPEGLLRSIYGSEKPPVPDSRPAHYDGPCDHIYIRLPDDAPDNLVWVWQPVRYHDNEGGNVLFKDGSVRWLTPEQLKAEVARTHKWLESHPTTQPATAPGRKTVDLGQIWQ